MFRPEDTIAFLGAEKPSAAPTTVLAISQQQQCEKKAEKKPKDGKKKIVMKKCKNVEAKSAKANKESKCKERPIISQPKHDLRHTCHVGADGRSFGLLNVGFRRKEGNFDKIADIQVDKNDLPRALPPRVASPGGSATSDAVSPIMISSTISLAPPRPPKGTSLQQMDAMSRSFCVEMDSSELNQNGCWIVKRLWVIPQFQVSPHLHHLKPPNYHQSRHDFVHVKISFCLFH